MSKSLKIGIILSDFEKSGVTSNTVDLCEGLQKLGHSVTLIVGNPKKDFQKIRSKYLNRIGVKQIFIPNVKGNILQQINSFFQITKIIIKEKFDILHFESIYLTFIAKLLHKKFVVTYHSYGLKNNFFSQHATRLISISEGITKDAITRHGYKNDEIDVVLHGVSNRFSIPYTRQDQRKIRESLNLPDDKIIIGIVASIEPRKGHHFLLKAVSMLPEEMKNMLHIVFCGNYKGDNSKEWILQEIQLNELKEYVSLIEFQDPLKIYQALDIFCLPSIWEGFPLTVIEAMMANCCVIRSNVQGCKEQIIEGVTGFSFESENPESLSFVIKKILTDTSIISDIASQARKFALDNFSLDIMAKNTVEVYKKTMCQ